MIKTYIKKNSSENQIKIIKLKKLKGQFPMVIFVNCNDQNVSKSVYSTGLHLWFGLLNKLEALQTKRFSWPCKNFSMTKQIIFVRSFKFFLRMETINRN